MLFSFLIASVSTGPTSTTSIEPDATSASPTPINITNGCGIDGAVDHAFLVTLKPAVNSDGSLLNTTEDKLSFLQGWVDQYTADQLEEEDDPIYLKWATRMTEEEEIALTHVPAASVEGQ